jgi:FMN phosphatase YigB (HAD superfamily)
VVSAVIFDLGGTLVDWPEWEEAVERWWVLSYNHLVAARPCTSKCPGVSMRRESMGREQRQLIADTICFEWRDKLEGASELESNAIYERVVQEDARIEYPEFLEVLQQLVEGDQINGTVFVSNVRITGVSPTLCEDRVI